MYAMSLSSGLLLLEKPAMAVAVSATGVILGWPFSILAFLPVTFYSLSRKFKQAFAAGTATSVTLLVSLLNCLSLLVRSTKDMLVLKQEQYKSCYVINPMTGIFQALSLIVDRYYYGRWTSSVLNLFLYNVVGGGESHLYGTEGALYYLRNGFNNFNFCFILALLFLVMLPILRRKYALDLLVVVSPIYIWLAFMSLQPHKEERLD